MESHAFGSLLEQQLTARQCAQLHYKDHWLRHAAAQLGVHRDTTLRWRHRFLALRA